MIKKWWAFGLVALLAAAGCGQSIPVDGESENVSAATKLEANRMPIQSVDHPTTDMAVD